MTANDGAPTGGFDATTLDAERGMLMSLAYRMLGTVADAEDAVQETYARWYRMSQAEQDAIENPAAWLTRVASRVCLDQLGSARARRERYIGEWLPEPLPGGTGMFATPPSTPTRRASRDRADRSTSRCRRRCSSCWSR